MKQLLFLLLSMMIWSCSENSNQDKDIDYDFTSLLNCTEFDWRDGYYITPYFGCVYDPEGINKYGNACIFLIPREAGFLEVEGLNNEQILEYFDVYVWLITPEYLVHFPKGDSPYDTNEEFKMLFFNYNPQNKTWDKIKEFNQDNWSDVEKYVEKKASEINRNVRIKSQWVGKFKGTFSEYDNDVEDPRAISTILIVVSVNKAYCNIDAWMYHENLNLQFVRQSDDEIVFSSGDNEFVLRKDGDKYYISCDFIDPMFEGNNKVELYKHYD